MRILTLIHDPVEPPALFGELLTQAGCQLEMIECWHAPLPLDLAPYAALLVMGGPQSANDELPYIHNELALLRHAIAIDLPILGICLGAQLLAKAAGGEIGRSPVRELGWYALSPTAAAASDPLFRHLPELPIFQWHGETFSLPPEATLLATNPLVPQQAFRVGRAAYGLQFHPEVDAALIELWIAAGASERAHLGEAGLDELRVATLKHLAAAQQFCRAMTQEWMGLRVA